MAHNVRDLANILYIWSNVLIMIKRRGLLAAKIIFFLEKVIHLDFPVSFFYFIQLYAISLLLYISKTFVFVSVEHNSLKYFMQSWLLIAPLQMEKKLPSYHFQKNWCPRYDIKLWGYSFEALRIVNHNFLA